MINIDSGSNAKPKAQRVECGEFFHSFISFVFSVMSFIWEGNVWKCFNNQK